MTLGVGESQQVGNDLLFSTQLMTNAASLDLLELGTVGPWSYGQGLRRAQGQKFFYELRTEEYSPFGVNHPVGLSARFKAPSETPASFSFETDLQGLYPELKNWKWTIIQTKNLSHDSTWFRECDATLKCDVGWLGFAKLADIKGWIVPLAQGLSWVASSEALPESESTREGQEAMGLMRIFLSKDVLGPQGRFEEWKNYLKQTASWGEWRGLNFIFTPSQTPAAQVVTQLASQGIALSSDETHIKASFGLSMMPEDVNAIMGLLAPFRG